jgi:polyketide biosynthesis enoyl-CoA hydratase PksI
MTRCGQWAVPAHACPVKAGGSMSIDVVEYQELAPGIVQIVMRDVASKNAFSAALVAGLAQAFDRIRDERRARVVVLTGYDSYFCSGGTHEELLALHQGHCRFTDLIGIYRAALDCEVPVIAAMQGHAIGGGFVFGLFADFVVLSRESVYTTNFMRFGFTPGMAATYLVPKKLGLGLGHEMLLSARTYRGADLEKRGVPFTVLPRSDVLAHAHQLAQDLADMPRASLVLLKNRLVADLREELPAHVEHELAMHEATLHTPEVAARIARTFADS